MNDSPCKKICKIDIETGLCLGCKRNINEIRNWLKFNDTEKREILIKTNERSQLFLKQKNNFILHSNKNPII